MSFQKFYNAQPNGTRVTRISKKKKKEEEEPGAWVVTAIALVPAAVGNFRVIQARGPAVT